MKIVVNGKEQSVNVSISVDQLVVSELEISPRGVAIAVNDSVVPRSEWSEKKLEDGDRVEIVRATQGG